MEERGKRRIEEWCFYPQIIDVVSRRQRGTLESVGRPQTAPPILVVLLMPATTKRHQRPPGRFPSPKNSNVGFGGGFEDEEKLARSCVYRLCQRKGYSNLRRGFEACLSWGVFSTVLEKSYTVEIMNPLREEEEEKKEEDNGFVRRKGLWLESW